MIIDDIKFGDLYRKHIQLATRRPKQAEDWDTRAESMSKTCGDPENSYVKEFIGRMDLEDASSLLLLDIGCGPGTICLPLASQFKKVYALDYSEGMLGVVSARAAASKLDNVQCIQKSWDDNWDDVPQCDIVVASRSTMVNDLEDAIKKLNAKARQHVYTTHTVDRHFIAADIMSCIGRYAVGFPNYIYTVNLLHQMGYLPEVSFIWTHECKKPQPGFEAFIESVRWSIGDLSEDEMNKLKKYFDDHGRLGKPVMPAEKVWAFVSWAV